VTTLPGGIKPSCVTARIQTRPAQLGLCWVQNLAFADLAVVADRMFVDNRDGLYSRSAFHARSQSRVWGE
jgi:hypothetical protein